MMEGCAHVSSATRIAGLDLDLVKCVSGAGLKSGGHGHHHNHQHGHGQSGGGGIASTSEGEWNCVECGTGLSPWICLACGLIHCGRYVNQDGLGHFKRHPDHPLCMDCHSFQIFCYACDEFVFPGPFLQPQLAAIQDSLVAHSEVRSRDHSYATPSLLLHHTGLLKGGHEQPPLLLPQSLRAPLKVLPAPRKPHIITNIRAVKVTSSSSKGPVAKVAAAASALPLVKGGKAAPKAKRKIEKRKTPETSTAAKSRRVALAPEEVVLGIRGLRNLGNTCFMNAVLQSLANIPAFAEDLAGLEALEEAPSPAASLAGSVRTRRSVGEQVSLSGELRKTLGALASAGSGAVSPDALFSVVWRLMPRFRGFHQFDAHEFLRCLMERLGTEASDALVQRHFQGCLASRLTCVRCGHSSWKKDPFLDLSLDIPLPSSSNAPNNNNNNNQVPLRLHDCLSRFFAPEELEGREQAECENCEEKTPTRKQFFLRRPPSVLCLHLKRFRWQFGRQKLDHFVAFPSGEASDGGRLSLESYLLPPSSQEPSESALYGLAAVVVHHGSGAGSGHYTAYGRRDEAWYHFNDASVRRSNPDIVRQQKAYLLFYVRSPPPSAPV